MTKDEFAQRLASEAHVSAAAAADELDQMVHDIIENLREGRSVKLPGLGTLRQKPRRAPRPERPRAKRRSKV